jgi:hypothetical protein
MTVGLSTSAAGSLARLWLNVLALTAVTTKTVIAVKLHTGDPGAAGTANASGNVTRATITFGSTTSGTITSSNAPQWTSWPSGQNGEVISHISLWDSTTDGAGAFLVSIALTASKTMGTGDTLTLTSGATSVALTPIAA